MKNILLICMGIVISQLSFSQVEVLDGITEKTLLKDRQILQHRQPREADVFWEKRIWRVIDVREKMNQAFMYPNAPFFDIIKNAAMNGELTLYSVQDDKFSEKLTDYEGVFFERDTVEIVDENYNVRYHPILNEYGYEDIKRFRIKEVWYFDESTSTMQVRILGIAPLRDVFDENGNFRYEMPLFWVYFPELRNVIARHEVYIPGNDNQVMSWDDLFEMRYFASAIYKEGNIHDRRIKDYKSGIDILLEADKIKQELFNFEHDLWSY
ncbi:MAG: gliding motility protein GldN [Bacteroidota bacterium]